MSILETLKDVLLWYQDDYSDLPDYIEVCAYFGLDPEGDHESNRDAINDGLALMGLTDDLADVDLGPAEGGVGETVH